MAEYTVDQLPITTSGKRMLRFVAPVYENSFWLKSYFDALGVDFDVLAKYFSELRAQTHIPSVTWGIEYLERKYSVEPAPQLNLEERRERLRIKATVHPPLNPAVLEKLAREKHDFDCYLDESHAGFINIIANRVPSVNANGFIPWLVEEKPAHLALEGRLIWTYYVGDERYSEDLGDLHEVTEAILPIDDADKKNFPRLFAGALEVVSGEKNISLARPDLNFPQKLHAATAELLYGGKTFSLATPHNQLAQFYIGQALFKTGDIRINTSTKPSVDRDEICYSWKTKLFAGIGNGVTGRKTFLPAQPRDQVAELFAGVGNSVTGKITFEPDAPRNQLVTIRVGALLSVSGSITISNASEKIFYYNRNKIHKVVNTTENNFATWLEGGELADSGSTFADDDEIRAMVAALFRHHDLNKLTKVLDATKGNLVAFGSNGELIDANFTFANEAAVDAMLDEIFGG